MSKSAYIKLVPGSKQETIDLDGVKQLLDTYCEMTGLTGKQLGWSYEAAAFPYEVSHEEQDGISYLYLKGKSPDKYNGLIIGTSKEEASGVHYIQIVLPANASHGDLAKGNEFSKFFAKQLKGELHCLTAGSCITTTGNNFFPPPVCPFRWRKTVKTINGRTILFLVPRPSRFCKARSHTPETC